MHTNTNTTATRRRRLHLGCTYARHQQLGIHAVINARANRQDLNDLTREEIEAQRDARSVRDRVAHRVRFYQFNSRAFRRRQSQLAHLLSSHDD